MVRATASGLVDGVPNWVVVETVPLYPGVNPLPTSCHGPPATETL